MLIGVVRLISSATVLTAKVISSKYKISGPYKYVPWIAIAMMARMANDTNDPENRRTRMGRIEIMTIMTALASNITKYMIPKDTNIVYVRFGIRCIISFKGLRNEKRQESNRLRHP